MSQPDRIANHLDAVFYTVSHYGSAKDVLADVRLSTDEKRVILSSWASDMYVVESEPTLREVPGISHRLCLDDILAALKQLDDDTDPPPSGILAMPLARFQNIDCAASNTAPRHQPIQASRPRNHLRWTREANVQRYRKLLKTQLTEVERTFVKRRLAEELRGCSLPLTTMEGIDVC